MGCAGSRPSQLLPSLGNHHHHVNSPQKGFILFNAKTIEYLQANELEIKEKLKQRCEQKLTKVFPQSSSSKSLLNNAKRTLFNTSSSAPNNNESASSEESSSTTSVVKPLKSDTSLTLNGTINFDPKMTAIDAAVDYVLKYALNDFDIENFKSSNHLSMKQIRKDIMKKNTSVTSLSKLNNSMSTHTNTGTLSNQAKAATLTKRYDASMYKQALNAAIDEFGLFVQENFIVINEFDNNNLSNNKAVEVAEKPKEKKEMTPESTEDPEAEALKLKEALAVARQNFYKGKISMVCLTKAGGYVVKEVKEPVVDSDSGLVVLPSNGQGVSKTSIEEVGTKPEVVSVNKQASVIPQINIEDADVVEKKLEEKKSAELQSIEDIIVRGLDKKESLTTEEFLLVKSRLITLLNRTVASIVSFTTNEETLTKCQSRQVLQENLEQSKRVVELLGMVNENDVEKVDEKLVEAVLSLDHVNKEFKSYLQVLNENKNDEKESENNDVNEEIRSLSVEIEALNAELPKELFSSKCLPHPKETAVKNEQIEISNGVESESKEPIDIRKEIAFSILNVGEVLAKTIDYYSNDADTQEIKDLIEISTKQQNKSKKTPELPHKCLETDIKPEISSIKSEKTPSPSSVSSSTSSTSSLSGSSAQEAASPKRTNDLDQEKEIASQLPTEPTTPIPPPELNIEYEPVLATTDTTPQPEPVKRLETEEYQPLEKLNFEDEEKTVSDEMLVEEEAAVLKCETKSSSSSSDVLSNEDLLIEPAQEQMAIQEETIPVVFRTETLTSQTTKRMSLDEELFYHLEEVDKKVKYMNETCSEDEGGDDDDDLDDENFDYDESVELENANDERLFHPRTPAKIKSEVRNNRTVDLQEEIKQISSVIQDLVQTINVRNSTNSAVNETSMHKSSLDNSDNNNADSEDGSQNSGSGGDCKTKLYHYNRNSNGSNHSANIIDKKSNTSNRRSIGSAASQSLNSSIPVSVSRQKIVRKSMTLDNSEPELINTESNNGSFINFSAEVPGTPEVSPLNNSNINKSASSQRFRSKLPVKK